MIPRQPHLKQVEYNNKVQLSNNLMLKDIIKKIKKNLNQPVLTH